MSENAGAMRAASLERGGKSSRMFVLILIAAMVGISVAVMIYVWRGRIPAQPGMLYVPEGTFLAGSSKTSAQLNAYFIDETEVRNADYVEFCRTTSTTSIACAGAVAAAPDLPVVNVTVAEARAFAQSQGKRLPTQLEWERIARGVDGGVYPWGNTADPTQANLSDNTKLSTHGLMPVRSFQAIPAYQMAGNVWEMVEGDVTPSDAAITKVAQLLILPTAGEKWIEIRGGSFQTPLSTAVTYESTPIPERYSSSDIGFRCAKTP